MSGQPLPALLFGRFSALALFLSPRFVRVSHQLLAQFSICASLADGPLRRTMVASVCNANVAAETVLSSKRRRKAENHEGREKLPAAKEFPLFFFFFVFRRALGRLVSLACASASLALLLLPSLLVFAADFSCPVLSCPVRCRPCPFCACSPCSALWAREQRAGQCMEGGEARRTTATPPLCTARHWERD
jgi:hypothetical protein